MNLKEFFMSEVETMANLFNTKQKQYGQVDELNNFKLGALLLDGKIDLDSEFESAKAYMAKHVAFLYSKNNNNISDEKIFESLGDIIVYCHIMRYMMKKNEKEHIVEIENTVKKLKETTDAIVKNEKPLKTTKKTLRLKDLLNKPTKYNNLKVTL